MFFNTTPAAKTHSSLTGTRLSFHYITEVFITTMMTAGQVMSRYTGLQGSREIVLLITGIIMEHHLFPWHKTLIKLWVIICSMSKRENRTLASVP